MYADYKSYDMDFEVRNLEKGINHNWQEIIRIGITQKVIATKGFNKTAAEAEISIRKCSDPTEKLKKI